MERTEIFKMINTERERQEKIHPTKHDDLFLLAVLIEEVGEVSQALQEGTNIEEELIQVAAVCFRWLESRQVRR